jgi:hypothetical protein
LEKFVVENKTAAELLSKGYTPAELYNAGFSMEKIRAAPLDPEWKMDEENKELFTAELSSLENALASSELNAGKIVWPLLAVLVIGIVIFFLVSKKRSGDQTTHDDANAVENPMYETETPYNGVPGTSNDAIVNATYQSTGGDDDGESVYDIAPGVDHGTISNATYAGAEMFYNDMPGVTNDAIVNLAYGSVPAQGDRAGMVTTEAIKGWPLSCIGARVDVVEHGQGTLHFIGKNAEGKSRLGVELDEAKGKSNGTVKGLEYFKCKKKHGLLALTKNVSLQDGAADEDGDFEDDHGAISNATYATTSPAYASTTGGGDDAYDDVGPSEYLEVGNSDDDIDV